MNSDSPVGRRVLDEDGKRRIVTDVRQGVWILRPVRGSYREIPVGDPRTLTLLALQDDGSDALV